MDQQKIFGIKTLLLAAVLTVLHSGSNGATPKCRCNKNEFMCGGESSDLQCTSCIPIKWKCDGDFDCLDLSDERDCKLQKCDPDWFQCENGKCIKSQWRCDGEDDCWDNSDEKNCPNMECDESQHKTCGTGACIPILWWCDGNEDCTDGSDEALCEEETCDEDDFKCTDGRCVEMSLRCDGEFDCRDGSDEECDSYVPLNDTIGGSITCKEDEFSCLQGGKKGSFAGEELDFCIPNDYVCDGESDCEGEVDEENCPGPCNADQYRCANGQCISLHNHCDGINNCGDGSDEHQCPDHEACIEGEFRCSKGPCISVSWQCDGVSDCIDGSDEQQCPNEVNCDEDQFKCETSKRCILSSWQCDGEWDCDDGTDELHCDCNWRHYKCASGQCISVGKLCNGVQDCLDGSDERPFHSCNTSMALHSNATSCLYNNGDCEHTCTVTSNGLIECTCEKGFQLAADMTSCVDVDECEVEGTCSQTCSNSVGSFSCSCLPGYLLRPDRRTCKASGPAPTLLFTNRIDIRQMNPDQSDPKPILRGLENAIGLDFHIKKGLVFWSDVTLDRIMRSNVNGSGIQEIVSSGLESPGGLAVDWIHDLLYWTDSGTSRIEVTHLDGSNRKVLIWEDLEKPRALALHPIKRLMFWTDWGKIPCLESAAMDGSMRNPVASRNVHWPNGLTIDYTNNHIYWSDAKYHIIEAANLDGSHRRPVVSRGLPHPFGVTIFEDKVYWTDWHTKSVNSANKFTGRSVKAIRSRLHFPMDIRTYHPLRQPKGESSCIVANCSHLCLPRPSGFICSCPTGFRRINETHCAENIESFLVFTRKSDIRRISFDGDERTDSVLPLNGLRNAVALDWHSGHPGYIYWSDVSLNTISRSEWDGSNQKVLISNSLDSPAGIAIDWITNKIYWTDSGINRIEVALLDGSMRSVLVWTGLDRPRAIIVNPKVGHMFWTDWGRDPKIERAGMDGSSRTTIVSTGLVWPNGITMDHSSQRIYWVDAGENIIESCDIDGGKRKVVVSGDLPHPFGIAVDDKYIYWTDWQSQSISYADKVTGENRDVLRKDLSFLMDIRYYHHDRPQSPNPCSIRNGGCSHLCLLSPNFSPNNISDRLALPYSCACPTGLILGQDKRNCKTEMHKFLAIARRSDIRVISLDVAYSADVKLNIDTYMTNVVDVAIDPVEDYIYWSDIGSQTISRSLLSAQPSEEEIVISAGLDTVDGLAVDIIGRLLYWTDDGRDTISVSTLDGKYSRILISKNLGSPRAIALHYGIGYMYWTDWGDSPKAKIERAGMDGSDRTVIISKDLVWPNGITIDYEMGWIIWGDAQNEKIEYSNLLGGDRTVIQSSVPHPYSLAYLDGYVYWTDWQTRNIHRINIYNATDEKTVRENMPSMMGIKAVSMDEHGVNRCGENKGGCSHLCLRSPTKDLGYACACNTGVRLQQDGKTCSNLPSEYLLFTTRVSIRRASLEADQSSYVELPVSQLENTIAIDYHYGQQQLFFTDVYLDVIKRANLDGSDVRTIVSKSLKTMDGLAVDWVANNLYWTDAGTNVISVVRLDGSSRKAIINRGLDEPRALSVHPTRGTLFWTDWGEKARIEKAYLDGTARKVLVKKNIYWPNGLTIDYTNSRIFWIDAHHMMNHVETCDFNGRKRKIVSLSVPHGFAITYLRNTLYWTDWQTKDIHSATLSKGKSKRVIKGDVALMGIKAVSAFRQTGTSPCDVTSGYGGCTHLCLMRGPRRYVCACPDPVILDARTRKINSSLADSSQTISSPLSCSTRPVYRSLQFAKTTAASKMEKSYPAMTTSTVLVKMNQSAPVIEKDVPIAFHVAVSLVAACVVFSVFAGFGLLLFRYLKQKRCLSNTPVSGNSVTFRNDTYSANSNSLLVSVNSKHTSSANALVNGSSLSNGQEQNVHLLNVSRTYGDDNPDNGIENLEESSSEYDHKSMLTDYNSTFNKEYCGKNQEEVDYMKSSLSSSIEPLLHDSISLDEVLSQTNRVNVMHDYTSNPKSDNLGYLRLAEGASSTDSISEQLFLQQLTEKQPKLSVATTCSILSEGSLLNTDELSREC